MSWEQAGAQLPPEATALPKLSVYKQSFYVYKHKLLVYKHKLPTLYSEQLLFRGPAGVAFLNDLDIQMSAVSILHLGAGVSLWGLINLISEC